MTSCPACGHGNPDGANFCAGCGARLTQVCGECGAPIVSNARFCTQCGNPVRAERPDVKDEAPDLRPGDAERRQLTVMFCDLVDSTRLVTDLDPEDVREINRAFRRLCTETIQRYEGYIARYMGDGILAYFGYPRAHEDDASRAVRSGLDIAAAQKSAADQPAKEHVAVRVGIATGPVVVGEQIGEGAAREHDVVGETPNLAARLQGLASPNEVVIGKETRELLGAAFELEDLGPQRLKGFIAPVPAWRVVEAAAIESRFEASRAGGLTPFIGREHEMSLVLDCCRRAHAGDGQVVLLSGEPGIGKSRITSMTREHLAGGDYVTVRLQCSAYHQNSSLFPFIEHLQRAAKFTDNDSARARLDKLERLLEPAETSDAESMSILTSLLSIANDRYPAPDLDPQVLRERTLAVLARGLEIRSRREPLLVLVEDVHWADPTTLELIGTLAERVCSWRALLMITFRPEFEAPWTGEAHVSMLVLNRLNRPQCESMIERLTEGRTLPEEIVAQIADKTDGIPLFIEELTRTILESGLVVEEDGRYVLPGPVQPLAIPTTLQDSLMARLDQLEDAKTLAQTGAAIGREFSHALLLSVSGRAPEDVDAALSRLLHSGLVFRRGTGTRASFVFKHALIQDTAYNSLLKSRRHALHGRIAEVLRRDFPDTVESQPELLAHHYTAAGLDENALPYWRDAGRRAMERSAHAEAISHFRRGLDCLAALDEGPETASQTVELQTSIAECQRTLEHMDEAFEALREAGDLAGRFDLKTHLARIHHQRGNLYFPMANTDACLAEHEQALGFARAAGSIEDEVRALGGLGDAYYASGRMRTAKEHFGRCVALAREHGFTRTAAANLSMHGFSRGYLLELVESHQDGEDAVAMATRASHPRAELLGHIMQYWSSYSMGNFERAIECCDRADELAKHLGARRFEPQNDYFRALSLYNLGRGDEAMAILDKAEPLSRQFSPRFALVRVLASIALITDDPERREKALAEGENLLEAGSLSHNYFGFYLDATDSAFDHAEWDRMEHYAGRLEAYTREEPLPWSDFVIARARALADWGRGGNEAAATERLRRLRDQADQASFRPPLGRIDKALRCDTG